MSTLTTKPPSYLRYHFSSLTTLADHFDARATNLRVNSQMPTISKHRRQECRVKATVYEEVVRVLRCTTLDSPDHEFPLVPPQKEDPQ